LTVFMSGGPVTVPHDTGTRVMWLSGFALCTIAVVTAVTRPPQRGGEGAGWTAVALGSAAALTTALIGRPLRTTAADHTLSGSNSTVEVLAGSLVLACVLFAMVLLPAALLGRKQWRDQPKRLRPWMGGWAAAPTLVLACLLGGGFGAGAAVAVRQLLGAPGLRLPESYTLITMLWGAALVVAALLAVAGVAVAVPVTRLHRGVPAIVRLLHPHTPPDSTQPSPDAPDVAPATTTPADTATTADTAEGVTDAGGASEDGTGTRVTAAAAWARANWERHWLHRLVFSFVLVMSLGAVALLLGEYVLGTVPGWLRPLSGVGVATLGLFVIGLLRVIVSAARGIGGRRHLGAF